MWLVIVTANCRLLTAAVEWTADGEAAFVEYMGVDHGGSYIFTP